MATLAWMAKWMLGKVNVNLYIHVFVFISNSIFHFSLSCLVQNYDFSLKVAKTFLSIIFKFSLISVWYLPLRAAFYRYQIVSSPRVEINWIYCSNSCYLLEKKGLQRFIKPQLLNFQDFQSGQLLSSCLGFHLNLSHGR